MTSPSRFVRLRPFCALINDEKAPDPLAGSEAFDPNQIRGEMYQSSPRVGQVPDDRSRRNAQNQRRLVKPYSNAENREIIAHRRNRG